MIISNEEMLKLIKADRLNQTINEVFGYTKNQNGWYDVQASIPSTNGNRKIILPYPVENYKAYLIKQEEIKKQMPK